MGLDRTYSLPQDTLMTLNQLIVKNNIHLPGDVLALCMLGLDKMAQSLDPLHDLSHCERLFDALNLLLSNDANLRHQTINFTILLSAICWHDVWKAGHIPKSIPQLLYDQYRDGPGSSILFKDYSQNTSLRTEERDAILYAIRVHGNFRVLPLATKESKILKDIDNLDQWSLIRVTHASRLLNKRKSKRNQQISMAYLYFYIFMALQTKRKYHYTWAKQEFIRRKSVYIAQLKLLQDQINNAKEASY
jgi:hypothetical protein